MEYHVADDTEHRYGGKRRPTALPSPPPSLSTLSPPTADETEVVWSFAYGANMNRDSLDKRKVTPLRTLPAILRNVSSCLPLPMWRRLTARGHTSIASSST